MRCWIYRSLRRAETYLYLRAADDLAPVPEALRARLGRLELVMELDLHPGLRLARADVAQVMAGLRAQGWFLQLPPAPQAGPAPRG